MSDAVAQAQQTIGVRAAEGILEFGLCVELQQAIWGYSTLDVVPDSMFIVAKKTGGQTLMAFDREKPVGFALAFVGRRDGRNYLHSHMVGVLEKYRDQGVGRLLKLAQGFELIEWTFDPLQLKNARFNIVRLGAIVWHYIPNLYGRTSSPLHARLPTDRLVAEWWVRSSRAQNAVNDLP
jgi:predicted GNAT superfamily acetyltransferase